MAKERKIEKDIPILEEGDLFHVTQATEEGVIVRGKFRVLGTRIEKGTAIDGGKTIVIKAEPIDDDAAQIVRDSKP